MKIFLRNIFKRIWSDRKQIITFAFVISLYYLITRLVFKVSCPLVYLTGLPCPACGLTRAASKLFIGDFSGAFSVNPSIYIVLFMILWVIVLRYIIGKESKLTAWLIIVGVFGCIAIYVHGMVHYFPDRYPYTYMYDNLFLRLSLR